MASNTDHPVWMPSEQIIQEANVTHFISWLNQMRQTKLSNYNDLWQWSVHHSEPFWLAIWDYFQINYTGSRHPVTNNRNMPKTVWFENANLNYADHVFKQAQSKQAAIVSINDADNRTELSWAELKQKTASLAHTLQAMGLKPGDRVGAFLSNTPESVIAFLACASIGAIWSICSPNMGEAAVLDRLFQIKPRIIIATDSYQNAGEHFDRLALLKNIIKAMSCVEQLILFPATHHNHRKNTSYQDAFNIPTTLWNEATSVHADFNPVFLPFNHPLWVVYSSGTTGLPKAMVHSQGGVLLEHLKGLAFHIDLKPNDRFHWFSNTSWMMWNFQVSGLLLGASIYLFDGNPIKPDPYCLWNIAANESLTYLGAGAPYFSFCQKKGISPKSISDFTHLRGIGSTAAPLSADTLVWILEQVKHTWVAPMSGGTDIVSAFVGGVPTLPVFADEMQCRWLGAKIESFNESSNSVIDEVGELVCTQPLPSMPSFFWEDTHFQRYQDSYFSMYPNVWRHGDWVLLSKRGGVKILGRSDATINRNGIRMGTAELYRAVDRIPEVVDSLVIDIDQADQPTFIPLFVTLHPGIKLSQELKCTINQTIKQNLSSYHVPNVIWQVQDIPKTLSGKKMELPIKKIFLGATPHHVANPDTMENPESLNEYIDLAKTHQSGQQIKK